MMDTDVNNFYTEIIHYFNLKKQNINDKYQQFQGSNDSVFYCPITITGEGEFFPILLFFPVHIPYEELITRRTYCKPMVFQLIVNKIFIQNKLLPSFIFMLYKVSRHEALCSAAQQD